MINMFAVQGRGMLTAQERKAGRLPPGVGAPHPQRRGLADVDLPSGEAQVREQPGRRGAPLRKQRTTTADPSRINMPGSCTSNKGDVIRQNTIGEARWSTVVKKGLTRRKIFEEQVPF